MASHPAPSVRRMRRAFRALSSATCVVVASMAVDASAQEAGGPAADSTALDTVQVTGNWLGSGLQTSAKTFPGARTIVTKEDIEASGATSVGDALRRIPGVQATDNSGTAGSAISLNVGIRGLTGRYSPRSTVLLDGIPMAVAPYGQPQLSFAPLSLNNIQSIDVVRSGGAVRYGPQNVGGIINFRTTPIPGDPLVGDVTVRQNEYTQGGGHNTQYGFFVGGQLDSGLGLALLYSGMDGSDWRTASSDRLNDVAFKFRYDLTPGSEISGKVSHYDVTSRTPGGLTVAQYDADPFQNTRPTDYWTGHRTAADIGYLNAISTKQEFEIRSYYSESLRKSALVNTAATVLAFQPRHYRVLGVEPRYTQRLALGPVTQDMTVGYRYVQERGDDTSYNLTLRTGATSPLVVFDNATDAHAFYIDDRIAYGAWRVTPGVRFEHIESTRDDLVARQSFQTANNKWLPSINVSYLVNRAFTVFANYSTSYGPVQNIQLNSQTPANPLEPEIAKTIEVGARLGEGPLTGELTLFKIRFDNQIQQVPNLPITVFQNIGATKHEGAEFAVAYAFDPAGTLKGVDVFANFTYTKALQESGVTAGRDLPFYSRITDTMGVRYAVAGWRFDVSNTHQTAQFADNANTFAEPANASLGRVPGFRVWNAQVGYRPPSFKRLDLLAGVNNVGDKRYYTRNVDGNFGRMVGAPRLVYVQGRLSF